MKLNDLSPRLIRPMNGDRLDAPVAEEEVIEAPQPEPQPEPEPEPVPLSERILEVLPGTYQDIAAVLDANPHVVATSLYRLSKRGLVVRTSEFVSTPGKHGAKPAIWDRA